MERRDPQVLNKQELLYSMEGMYTTHQTFHNGFLLGGRHSKFVEKDVSVSCLQCVADLILRIPDVHVVTHNEYSTQEEWHRNGYNIVAMICRPLSISRVKK